ncbi:alternative ribosome rescue aminoacyl-tRNA hydrolase ArfB [Ichthyenterobacterium sp. W332]|uniref:Alternative ribosome rescue aminoacyl-tRNA hydrolase ArfB n=1 Tax=Microcosmobacter mediterraneus TaxID=3075607 RepID=A0ABU2YJ97_9FLAO|nr:alternative ribosome rescue aminoacyl-tRNA hydrolase ArfB [Ichthyenterobacterium sp. W332]MDT0558226.1 alternative ribosome rescue aminoacyl-tRNA hydrolase ArfB [Ichthyenterobacterium sp. W332]
MQIISQLISELSFKAIRSSGKGGQHVNKVSSKVELSFNINASQVLSEEEKERLTLTLQSRITQEGLIILQCDETRSQHRNKTLVIQRFIKLIEDGLIVMKKRKSTKIPKAVKEKRLKNKRFNSEKKSSRKKPDID